MAFVSVQAEEVSGTITFKTSGSDSSSAANTGNFVTGQVTANGGFTLSCTATNNCYTGKSGLKMSSSKASGSFTLGLGDTYNVKKVIVNAVKYSSDAAMVAVNGATAQSLSSTATDYTFAVNSEINQIKVDMTKRGYIASITIVYEVAGGEGGETQEQEQPETPPVVETVVTPTITPASTTFNQGESLSVTIETETEGAEIYYTLDGSDPVENGGLYEGEIELTKTTTVKAVAMLDGWNNSEVVEATFTAIEPVTPPASGESKTVTFTASENGYSNSQKITTVKIDDYVTASFNKGTNNNNAPTYYSGGTAIRCYGGNNFTVASTAGNITKIVLNFGSSDGSNDITANEGTFSTDTWTGASNEVVLTIGEQVATEELLELRLLIQLQVKARYQSL